MMSLLEELGQVDETNMATEYSRYRSKRPMGTPSFGTTYSRMEPMSSLPLQADSSFFKRHIGLQLHALNHVKSVLELVRK